ncbi:MAG TPA: lipid-binding SYLF domain-containing protein [Vicinamibacterales bacterium]|jgi:lipid-binding SYLF domain-containing protein
MIRRIWMAGIVMAMVGLAWPARAASNRSDDIERIDNSAQVFQDIMKTPDKAVPQELLETARCIAIIPNEKKAAFGVGGRYGKGLATCRTANGWSAPLFITVGGGSIGWQIGGSSTDIVMLFMNDAALQRLLSDKFRIGGEASAAAGPVGRHAAASTDIKLHAEILTYSRSRGVFAGVSLDGAVIQPDESGNQALYGDPVNREKVLNGSVAVPTPAKALVSEISRYAKSARNGQQ